MRTADATTGTPTAGRVILNGADIAATNTPFTYTSGATAPTGTVTAPHYPPAQIGWPALRPPRLTLSVAPYPVPLRVATSITVRAIDLDTGAPVDGTVTIGTTAVGRTNTPFAYTLTPNRIRVYDPETRTYTYETVTPTGNVTTAGYPTTPIDFGV